MLDLSQYHIALWSGQAICLGKVFEDLVSAMRWLASCLLISLLSRAMTRLFIAWKCSIQVRHSIKSVLSLELGSMTNIMRT
jgi:hypothetical protein